MKVKRYLRDISSKSWEHPADRAALAALRSVPGFGELLQKLMGMTTEKSFRLIFLASAIRVSERQFPKIHNLVREACDVLDVQKVPEVYISQDPFMNAETVGVKNPFIIVNSSLIERLSDDELLAVIGHEVSHCLSGHALYKTLLLLILNISALAIPIPGAALALQAIVAALKEWDRKSEMSADRAGLLVGQDPNSSYTVLMKLAGGARLSEMSLDEFFSQASEYESGGDILDSVYKLLNLLGKSHPFPVLRLAELKSWLDSGSYEDILSGKYKRRQEDEADDVMKEFADAAQRYKEDIEASKDPLTETITKIGKDLEVFEKQAEDFFKSIFK